MDTWCQALEISGKLVWLSKKELLDAQIDSQGIRYAKGYLMMVPSAAASTVIFCDYLLMGKRNR